jgi:hypothetical protein
MVVLPPACINLVKATEFWFRDQRPDTDKICVPKMVKKYEGYGDDSKLWSISIKSNFNRVSNDTITRMKNVAYAKMYSLIQDRDFLDLLRAKEMNHNAILTYIADRISTLEACYMHVESRTAISFPFG